MAASRGQRKLRVRKTVSPAAMPEAELMAARQLIAKLIARAYLDDNPHPLAPGDHKGNDNTSAGQSPPAPADTAPAEHRGRRDNSTG